MHTPVFGIEIQELIEGVANGYEFAGVQSGETVLLIQETTTNARVGKAFVEVGRFYGAEVCEVTMEPVWPPKEAPWMLTNAMKGADVAFGLSGCPSIWRHPGAIEAMKLHKSRCVSLATMCSYETLASDAAKWPMEIYWKIVEKMEGLARGVKKIRVTNPRGTGAKDLAKYLSQYENSLHFNEISWGHNPRMPLQSGDKMLIQANRPSSVLHLGVRDALMDGGRIFSKVKVAGSIM